MATKVNKKNVKKTNIKESTISNDNELLKLIKLVGIVSLIFLVFYLITIFINKEEESETVKTPATIQYDEILVGNILNQSNKTYYVLIQDIDDYNIAAYSMYISLYEEEDDAERVYTATLNNPLNSRFFGEEVVYNTTDATKLRFNKTAFVKVTDGKITEYYDEDDIKTALMKLTGTKEESEESEE